MQNSDEIEDAKVLLTHEESRLTLAFQIYHNLSEKIIHAFNSNNPDSYNWEVQINAAIDKISDGLQLHKKVISGKAINYSEEISVYDHAQASLALYTFVLEYKPLLEEKVKFFHNWIQALYFNRDPNQPMPVMIGLTLESRQRLLLQVALEQVNEQRSKLLEMLKDVDKSMKELNILPDTTLAEYSKIGELEAMCLLSNEQERLIKVRELYKKLQASLNENPNEEQLEDEIQTSCKQLLQQIYTLEQKQVITHNGINLFEEYSELIIEVSGDTFSKENCLSKVSSILSKIDILIARLGIKLANAAAVEPLLAPSFAKVINETSAMQSEDVDIDVATTQDLEKVASLKLG